MCAVTCRAATSYGEGGSIVLLSMTKNILDAGKIGGRKMLEGPESIRYTSPSVRLKIDLKNTEKLMEDHKLE